MPKKILVADDNPFDREINSKMLEKLGFEFVSASNGEEALHQIKNNNQISLVLLDLVMPGLEGMDALKQIKTIRPELPVIIVSSNKSLEDAVECMRLGATDYVSKPVEQERIYTSVQNALKIATMDQELRRLKKEQNSENGFDSIIGQKSISEVVESGRKAAKSDIAILVTGESGVGKEVFARALHAESRRSGNPFIAVNCGAIPEKLVESTLFGHEKGSFTGAIAKVLGKFREAQGGTIFLDEIGELPQEAQVKLLRVLQQKEIEPVGLGKPVTVDVRIISATNRDLGKMISAGQFREDLFYRLNSFTISIPPLRKRTDSLHELVEYFCQKAAAQEGKPFLDITENALRKLEGYSWPGNIRELENTISRAALMCENNTIDIDDIQFTALPQSSNSGEVIKLYTDQGMVKKLDDIEAEIIQHLMEKYSRPDKVAEILGIGRATVYRKVKP